MQLKLILAVSSLLASGVVAAPTVQLVSRDLLTITVNGSYSMSLTNSVCAALWTSGVECRDSITQISVSQAAGASRYCVVFKRASCPLIGKLTSTSDTGEATFSPAPSTAGDSITCYSVGGGSKSPSVR
ncbi:hypothetical protein C8J56DRAFT_381331 [Mycena floridula]|nr:hypothetical protein C8J56DRAFT_381331 [Mycena floridula]